MSHQRAEKFLWQKPSFHYSESLCPMNIKVFCAYRYTGRISTLAKVLRHGQFKFHELTPGEDFIGCFLDMIHRNRSPASRIGTSYLEPTSILSCRFVLSIGKVDSIISPQYFYRTEFMFNYERPECNQIRTSDSEPVSIFSSSHRVCV